MSLFSCEKTKHFIIVMCDLSSSNNPSAIEKLKNYVSTIFEKNPAAYIYYYPIDGKTNSAALLKKASFSNLRPSELQQHQEKDLPELLDKIEEIFNTGGSNSTCILKSLNTVNQALLDFRDVEKVKDFATVDIDLIFLSDMLESCDNEIGRIDLEIKNNLPNAQALMMEKYSPSFNFAQKGVKISFVDIGNDITLQNENVMNFWREVSKKLGYTAKEIENFPFTGDLPSRFGDAQ